MITYTSPSPTPGSAASRPDFTERELTILRFVNRGLSDKQIAAQLFISVRTVHFHVNNLLVKLEAGSRMEAAYIGRIRGIIHDSDPVGPPPGYRN